MKKIYDDSDERKLCLTRRFMVVDNQVIVEPDVRAAYKNDQRRSHQEVDFNLRFQEGVTFNAPDQITATVIQNGIWSKAISEIKPLFIKTDQLSFRYQNKICFESGKEYRFVDMRSLDNRLLEGNWYETDNTYQVLVYYRPFGKRYDQLIGYKSFNRFN